jgi:phage gp45-like
MNPITLIKNLFKIAKLLSVDDSGDYQFMTVTTLGKTQKVLSFKPYGLMSNPPVDSIVSLLSQQGQESNGIGTADDPKNRIFSNMEPGEVALGNYDTGAALYFASDGTCFLASSSTLALFSFTDIAATAPTIELIASTAIKHTAPTIELNGNGDNLVTFADLNSLLASYWAIYNGHSHAGAGLIDSTVSFDISAAKATTLKTDG